MTELSRPAALVAAAEVGLASRLFKDKLGDDFNSFLTVEDDGVGAEAALPTAHPAGSGLGLKIIAERLGTLYQGRASLDIQAAESWGSRVTILIPRDPSGTIQAAL